MQPAWTPLLVEKKRAKTEDGLITIVNDAPFPLFASLPGPKIDSSNGIVNFFRDLQRMFPKQYTNHLLSDPTTNVIARLVDTAPTNVLLYTTNRVTKIMSRTSASVLFSNGFPRMILSQSLTPPGSDDTFRVGVFLKIKTPDDQTKIMIDYLNRTYPTGMENTIFLYSTPFFIDMKTYAFVPGVGMFDVETDLIFTDPNEEEVERT